MQTHSDSGQLAVHLAASCQLPACLGQPQQSKVDIALCKQTASTNDSILGINWASARRKCILHPDE